MTPNHWHTLAALWAIQAGKHVTVEKPSSHTVHEGRLLAAAAKKAKVIVQDGAEQRSNPCAQTMAKFLQDGGLGEVYLAKGLCYKWRKPIGRVSDEPVPKASITTSGSARLPCGRSIAIASITTGTGTGITETATSAIRACTRSTSRAGASA